MPRLELRNVRKERPGTDRSFELHVRSFALGAGEQLAVLGPSGCGKTTLLGLCGLASSPTSSGTFALHDESGTCAVDRLWRTGRHEELARMRARLFGYVLQTGGVLPFQNVRGNVELGQRLSGRRDSARVDLLLDRLDIAALAREEPARLSVGQRQRVGIARALAHRPGFVIADEPTAALDPGNAKGVIRLLLELTAADGAALLLVSHDRRLIEEAGIPVLDMEARGGDARRWTSVVDHPGRSAAP
ncbi:MAG: ATP-binding cassette domain-containing protein [Acetobacteraceae bacterium]|nr:ATP-binding cassette domain-containing protein [Acetobacteraceae bacterium]